MTPPAAEKHPRTDGLHLRPHRSELVGSEVNQVFWVPRNDAAKGQRFVSILQKINPLLVFQY